MFSRLQAIVLSIAALPAAADGADLLVGAASSLKEPLEDLQALWKRHRLQVSFAATGSLARQLRQGAPFDVVLLASSTLLDDPEVARHLEPGSRTLFASNSLVVVGQPDAHLGGLAGLADPRFSHIALGEPRSVPAGEHAAKALRESGLWETLQGRLVFAASAKQAAQFVEAGNAQAGFAFATDARTLKNARVLFEIPARLHEPIAYEAAVALQSSQKMAARDLCAFLISEQGQRLFAARGFLPPPKAGRQP